LNALELICKESRKLYRACIEFYCVFKIVSGFVSDLLYEQILGALSKDLSGTAYEVTEDCILNLGLLSVRR
jgi:hypothetical protein